MKYANQSSHSKSKFSLIKIKNTIFIKKKPVKIDKREFLSIKKQNNFKTYYLNGYEILSAKIIENTRYIKKNKNYLVEFFNGKNGMDILLSGNKEEISILKKFFYNYFFVINDINNIKLSEKKIIYQKIKEIKKKTNVLKIKNIDLFFIYLDKLLKKKIYLFQSDKCHGDFTLSNFIINSKDKKIILLDFQTTYQENLMQDFSKLFQDFSLNWTARNFTNNDFLRSQIIYSSIVDKSFWNKINKKMINSLKLEFLMTVLRIIPYVNKEDSLTKDWIKNSLSLIKKFRLI